MISTQLARRGSVTLFATCAFALTAAAQSVSAELPAGCSAYASIPLPAEAEIVRAPETFPACASYRSYRGIGRPVSYGEARACAWQERLAQKAGLSQNPEAPTAWVVGGSLILADIYVNGAGVTRNIPLAMRFACESNEATARLALDVVRNLNRSPRSGALFEFCDYASTTLMMTFCSAYALEIEDNRRDRYYRSLKQAMTQDQKAAFAALLAAQKAYVSAHAYEVDQRGTSRSIRTIGSQDILSDLFRTEVVHFERGKWPALSSSQVATADALERNEYEKTLQRLRSNTKEDVEQGAVAADELPRVEQAWQAYRDAWMAFARLRYSAAATTIRAQIVLDRSRLLATIR